MKTAGRLVIIVAMIGLLAVQADAQLFDANPAYISRVEDHQIAVSVLLQSEDSGIKVAYGEPDYGHGAGALGWAREIEDGNIYSSFYYGVGKELRPGLSGGVRVRYLTHRLDGAGTEYEGQFITSDLGVIVSLGPRLSVDLSAQDVWYHALHDSPRDLLINLRSAVHLQVLENAQLYFAVNDLLQSFETEQDWQLGAVLQLQDYLQVRADYTRGIAYTGAKWSAEADLIVGNAKLNYGISGVSGHDGNLAHQFGLGWSF